MRLFTIIILFAFYFPAAGQSGQVRKITLGEAVSDAILKNPSLKSDIEKKNHVAKVETAYFDQVYQICRYNTLKQQAYLFRDLERVADLRYNAGDIDLLEKTRMKSRIAEIRTDISMLDDDIAITSNKLKLLLASSEDIVPADSVLTMYAVQKGKTALSASDSPENLSSDQKQENLEYELNRYFKKIQYFRETALGQADILFEINKIRYEQEEIDYTEYTLNLDEAFRIRLEFLQTLYTYNQIAIQLELYAY